MYVPLQSATPFMGTYSTSKHATLWHDVYAKLFIVALFTIQKMKKNVHQYYEAL